jgi:hypothetical protein
MKCTIKRDVAEHNVYYRFPVLQYRQCPFPVDAYRETVSRDDPTPKPRDE